ncbi:hypothetical protein DMH04_06585 [Kibdelosporangium aridum]|uniref:Uncharacterized protein n=1 Tax=Kibdelosporangium aridum TaxID=2030 RepID=A0A428ZNL2_KIBAR|nr:tyrosine-protein phosphatase [Kibdelosporangium aridum]RSM89636.1 hypothetical protein DMH04_06585 [Kibdelosporangium aridum]
MMLAWEGCLNGRDVGGLPSSAGRRTRFGALLRSDSHSRLTADGRATVRAERIIRTLDLQMGDAPPGPLAVHCSIGRATGIDRRRLCAHGWLQWRHNSANADAPGQPAWRRARLLAEGRSEPRPAQPGKGPPTFLEVRPPRHR